MVFLTHGETTEHSPNGGIDYFVLFGVVISGNFVV